MRPTSLSLPRVQGLMLGAALLLVWHGVMKNGFVNYDDPFYVHGNTWVCEGLNAQNLLHAFGSIENCNWHPLTWISHLLDITLFNLRPGLHHGMNLAFHVVNVLLLWKLLKRWQVTALAAWVLAFWFGVHPLRVESVAWISERKDVLSVFFGLLSLQAWTSHRENPGDMKARHHSLIAFSASLLCKPMLVTFPFLLLLLDFWPFGTHRNKKSSTALILEKGPFFLLSAFSCAMTYFAQSRSDAIKSALFPFELRAANAVITPFRYLVHMIWPVDLTVFYPYPDQWPAVIVLLASAGTFLGLRSVWIARYRHPRLAVGVAWFLFSLLPVLGLVQAGTQSMADRYTYWPMIGVVLALSSISWPSGRIVRTAGVGAIALMIGWQTSLTIRQINVWRDSITLFRHCVRVTGPNSVGRIYLAVSLFDEGQREAGLQEADRACALEYRDTYAHELRDILRQKTKAGPIAP